MSIVQFPSSPFGHFLCPDGLPSRYWPKGSQTLDADRFLDFGNFPCVVALGLAFRSLLSVSLGRPVTRLL